VEAAVVEVVLDPRAADPRHAAVDDEQLAVVDAPGRAHDADVDPAGPQPVVEATRPAGPRADPVDDDPHRDPLGGLGEQRAGEPLPDLTGTEAVLVDVDRGRRARDVVQDQREEVLPRDVDVDGRGRGLVEHQREVAELDLRARELLRAGADVIHAADRPSRARA